MMKKQKETYMKKVDVENDEKIEELKQQEDESRQNSIFDTEEIRIEELAIDGICGVY
jgi:mycofactocin precursor